MRRHGFLIDMDGVIYRERQLIPGAERFIASLLDRGIPFVVSHQQQPAHAARRGDEALADGHSASTKSHIFTCAMATARFLAAQKPGGTAFVIGEGGLLQALHKNGYAIVDDDPDYVVVGEGRTFNMEIVEAAVRMILRGSKLIATNIDPNCPTRTGLRPGCGAIVAMLETATGLKAFSVGKPSPVMMRAARKELGLATDRDDHDRRHDGNRHPRRRRAWAIARSSCSPAARAARTSNRYAYRPDLVVDSIADLCDESTYSQVVDTLEPFEESVVAIPA